MTFRKAIFCLALAALPSIANGQSAFDDATVKVVSFAPPGSIGADSGRLIVQHALLRRTLAWAYGIRAAQVSGPQWLNQVAVDIRATADASAIPEQFRLMTQKLLQERFPLTLRRDTQEVSVLAVVVGADGPKFNLAAANQPAGAPIPAEQDFVLGQPVYLDKATLPDLVEYLNRLSRGSRSLIFVDETNLTREYDLELVSGDQTASTN